MTARIKNNLNFSRKLLLAASAAFVAAAPIIMGAMSRPATANQAPAAGASQPKPSFEVVSIKPGSPVLTRIAIQIQGNRFLGENFNLKMLVERAFGVPPSRVLGGPDWVESARYNVEAKAEGPAIPPGQLGPMLQTMLEDRFQLKARRETRELPIYELVVARGGPKMKLSEDQTPLPAPNQLTPEQLAKLQAAARGGGPMPAVRGNFNRGNGQYTGTGVAVSALVSALNQQLGRPVIDKTGLTGLYDFSMKWTPGAEQVPGPFGPPPGTVPPGVDPNGPSLFTAIQEQLGLRLESTKGPVEVIVIDSAQKPTEN